MQKKPAVKKQKKQNGRPKGTDKYKPEYAEQAYRHCLLGATNPQLGDLFGVSHQTIDNWSKRYKSFFDAIKRGKAEADANVAQSLYKRATGYEHEDEHILSNGKKIKYTKKYAPDNVAMIFWLKNRQSALWRDKINHEVSGKDGEAIEQNINIKFIEPGK